MIFARRARLQDGWSKDVRVEIIDGRIAAIETGSKPDKGDSRVDSLLPAIANLHSHSFQRTMAGMSEYRAPGKDSFWTWRALMYRYLDHLTPGQIEAIAAQAFVEMQEAGFAAVGEFHYLHHQPGGVPYDNPDELGDRIFAAAQSSGIGLTHLPVFYSQGGADRRALAGGQLRFGNDLDRFSRIFSAGKSRLSKMPKDTALGIAPHSLRAVSIDDLKRLLSAHPTGPVHLHIAEQVQEVTEIKEVYDKRPIELLLEYIPVDRRWCLIHATHMTVAETTDLAKTGAVAGLCPITEANLGDGIFDGPTYLQAGGLFGIGTDSNIRISMQEELRGLEYSQRLRNKERNVLATKPGSTGEAIYLAAAKGGAQALGRDSGEIRLGAWADLLAINSADTSLCALSEAQLFDGLIFAAGDRVITDLWSAGRHCVVDGQHIKRKPIAKAYRKAMAQLLADI